MARVDPTNRQPCPCCGYPTLGGRGGYEICELCWWEDDRQDDAQADEVRGGPNQGYSLTQARQNFRQFLVMYEPERDRRVGGPDSETTRDAKRLLMRAFDQLATALPDELPARIAEVYKQERRLELEQKETLRAYDAALRRSRESPERQRLDQE